MTLLGIQQRFREVGRIRTGERVTKNGKTFPSRLDTFRFTSSDQAVIEAVAAKYGGKAEVWERGWQVTTTSDRIAVMLPPAGTTEGHSLWYELWSGGGIARRCDGQTAIVGSEDSQCVCDPENRECKPTLRVSFILPDLPGLGVWRLETKGYNAAAELPGTLNLLRMWADQGRPVRAQLRLEQRESISNGKKKLYAVPVLDPYGTINDMLGSGGVSPSSRPQLPSSGGVDDLPLLPHELDQPDGAPAGGEADGAANTSVSPIEPAESEVREDSAGVPPRENSAEVASATDGAGASAPALSSDQIEARYAWGEAAGWTGNALDDQAIESMGRTVMEMSPDEWAIFARTVKSGPPIESAAEPVGHSAAVEPPRQGTEAYKAMGPAERKAAREYWASKDVPA